LQRALEEIRSLRRRIELADARLDMFDRLTACVFAETQRYDGVCVGEDIAWAIERFLEADKGAPTTRTTASDDDDTDERD
jgi:hypothetical protein